jgi:hypothetical protein
MLLEKAFLTKGKVQPCEIVVQASKEYRAKQDVISEFVVDMIVPDKAGKITKTEIQQYFSTWYRGAYGNGGPSMTEVHEALDRMFGNYNRVQKAWIGVRLVMNDNHSIAEEGAEEESVGSNKGNITSSFRPVMATEPMVTEQPIVSGEEETVVQPLLINQSIAPVAKKRIIRKKN